LHGVPKKIVSDRGT
jgi:hypothetical protein